MQGSLCSPKLPLIYLIAPYICSASWTVSLVAFKDPVRKWKWRFARFVRFILLFHSEFGQQRADLSFCISIYFYLFTFYLPTLEPFSYSKVCSLHFVWNCPHTQIYPSYCSQAKGHKANLSHGQLQIPGKQCPPQIATTRLPPKIKMFKSLKTEPMCSTLRTIHRNYRT